MVNRYCTASCKRLRSIKAHLLRLPHNFAISSVLWGMDVNTVMALVGPHEPYNDLDIRRIHAAKYGSKYEDEGGGATEASLSKKNERNF